MRRGILAFAGLVDSWTNAVTAITAFLNDPASKGIDVGFGTFPVGANNTFDCTGGTPVVPIAPVESNAQLMTDVMNAQRPSGLAFTPMECRAERDSLESVGHEVTASSLAITVFCKLKEQS